MRRLLAGTRREIPRFILTGAVGFCVDAAFLAFLMAGQWSPLSARAVSFAAAVTVTWALNRAWTFRTREKRGLRSEYSSYFLTQCAGALVNLSIFFVLIWLHPKLRLTPVIPLACGAAAAMVFNYTALKLVVFRG